MKRTIQFRAQDIKTGDWRFGYYYPDFQDNSIAFILSEIDGIVYKVKPHTIEVRTFPFSWIELSKARII